jgi:two-component system, OmpR family, sensor kinase
MSLRTRLLAGLGAVAVVLIAVAALVTATTRNYLVDQLDQRLELAGGGDERGGRFGGPAGRGPSFGDDDGPPERLSDLYEGLLLPDGELITIFEPNLYGDEVSVPDLGGVTTDAITGAEFQTTGSIGGDTHYRVLLRPVGDRGVFVTAAPLDDVDRAVRRLVLLELLGAAAVLAVLGAVAWWMIRLGIRPIKDMTATAQAVAGSDLTVRVGDGGVTGTEAHQLAGALNAMLDRIESAVDERAKSEERLRTFVADASHELRTPVTTIRGYAELYDMGGLSEPAELDDAMRRTKEEAQRMGRLVEDMLTLAKLDEERPLELASVDLATLATDAANDARAVAPDRSITIDAEPARVNGDADRLRQVVANLVANALVHSPPTALIRLRTGAHDGMALFEVRDDGPGMAPEVVARVTERFYRADPSRARSRGGSGLGMAIVDAVVTAHGGAIEIDSVAGDGTTVRVLLPSRLG